LITFLYFNIAPSLKNKAIIEAIKEGQKPPRRFLIDPETKKCDYTIVLCVLLAAAN
jgi:hypothetical protein